MAALMVLAVLTALAGPGQAGPGGDGGPAAHPAGARTVPTSALHASGRTALGTAATGIRSDEQAQLHAVGASAAWPVSRGSGVTVGVLDTGVDPGVPDLAGSVIVGPDDAAGANPPGYQPPRLHGTYIASLIAGHGSGPGRTAGVIGVAPAARVLSVRVILDDQEPGFTVYNENSVYDNAIGNGIRYAVSHGAGVINMSLGATRPTRDMRAAVGYAIAHGVVVVAAAGNDGAAGGGFTPYGYPASFPGVISVAAVGAHGARASFSDRNASVVISAPGVNVVGAGPGGSYLQGSGTSPASGLVAGVAALIRSRYPHLSPAMVEQAMISSASRRPAGGYTPGVGFGEVDAPAALAMAARLAAAPPQTGLAPGAHFGGRPGPIEVVHRDTAAIAGYGAAGAILLLSFLALLIAVIVRLRRSRPPEQDLPQRLLPKSHINPLMCLSMLKANGGSATAGEPDDDPAISAEQELPQDDPDGQYSSPQPAAARRRGLKRWRRATVAVLAVFGLCVAGAGGTALALEMTRHATSAEAQATAQTEVDSRWERLPAGRIFPSELGYTDSAGSSDHVHRVGIAPRAGCAQATDPVIGRALVAARCVTVLRATYIDGSGTLVTTVGIAVMPSTRASVNAYQNIDADTNAGLRAVGFSGTASSLFANAQRQEFTLQAQGPYIFFQTDGYGDGRHRTTGPHEAAFGDIGDAILGDLAIIMSGYGNPCREKDIRC
jgi:hypothetical protein